MFFSYHSTDSLAAKRGRYSSTGPTKDRNNHRWRSRAPSHPTDIRRIESPSDRRPPRYRSEASLAREAAARVPCVPPGGSLRRARGVSCPRSRPRSRTRPMREACRVMSLRQRESICAEFVPQGGEVTALASFCLLPAQARSFSESSWVWESRLSKTCSRLGTKPPHNGPHRAT